MTARQTERAFFVKQSIVRDRYVMVCGKNPKDAEEQASAGYGELVNGREMGLTQDGPRKSWLLASEVSEALE